MTIIAMVCLGYVLGSIPFGYLIPKWLKGVDIRTIGSKNMGATNVYRLLGIKWAVAVFTLDALKGSLFVVLLAALGWLDPHGPRHLLLIMPLIGHCFPCWLKFKGGRGVATGAGVAAVVSLVPTLVGILGYITVVKITKESFLGSLSGLALFVVLDLVWGHGFWWPVLVVLSVLILLKHRTHIMALYRGQQDSRQQDDDECS